MNNILTLNKISKNGLDRFGERYVCSNDVKDRMRYLSVRHQCTNMIFQKILLQ